MSGIRKINVDVTWDNIERGQLKHCLVCPIALAIYDALGMSYPHNDECSFLFVNHTNITLNNKHIDLPGVAIQFIRHFDRRMNVEPFSFELEVPV